MKKTTKQQNGNTLFNYFQKKPEKKEKKEEPLSSIIARQSFTNTAKNDTIQIKKTATFNRAVTSSVIDKANRETLKSMTAIKKTASSESYDLGIQCIDLTNDDSQSSSQSSFKSSEQPTSMTNTSKFNKKVWAPIDSRRAPLRSSQEPVVSRNTAPQVNKVKLHSRPTSSTPRYDWLGENDVKPYSSNYSPYSITPVEQKPRILPYNMTSAFEESERLTFGKKRGAPIHVSKDQWSRAKSVPGRPKGPASVPTLSTPPTYRPQLSAEQQHVLDMVLRDRKSLFFTGSAGTGKSVLLRAIIDELESIHGPGLAVTASTGIAAININGCTLHR